MNEVFILKTSHDPRYRLIARRVVYYRNQQGLSQDALAEKVKISKSYLSKIEAPNSNKAYSLDVLFAIADGLGIDVSDLFQPIPENE